MERRGSYFPNSNGKPRVDDRRVLSGIVFVKRNGLKWHNAPRENGPRKRLTKRWSGTGVFARNFEGLAVKATVPGPIILPLINCCAINERATDERYPLPGSCLHANHETVQDAPHREKYRREKGGAWATVPLPRRAMHCNGPRGTKLHAVRDGQGRPLSLCVTAGQVSDYIGARALLSNSPKVEWLLGPSLRNCDSAAGQRIAYTTPTGLEKH